MLLRSTNTQSMTKSILPSILIIGSLAAFGGMAMAAQDKFSLKAPSGISFADFKGYENWPDIAVSQTDGAVKVIAANPTMLEAYRAGAPGNGKPFPEGSKIVKIEWAKKKNPEAPAPTFVPDTLTTVEFIEKDSARFPKSSGWGYAQFMYDAATDTFTEKGALPERAANGTCHACHTIVKAKDFIFTAYPKR
jgi:Cytochrome P460